MLNVYYLHKVVNIFIYIQKIIFYYLRKMFNNFLLFPQLKLLTHFLIFIFFQWKLKPDLIELCNSSLE